MIQLPEGDIDARRQQLVEHLSSLDPKQAEVAIGAFYHVLENEVTKPDAGIYVTRYFISKWKPSLGSDAANIVQALRLLSDPDGWTFASYETIAKYAGVSQRAVERWLSDSPSKERGDGWLQQWTLLHTYFLRESKPRFRQRTVGNLSRVQRTTNSIRVAKDDPVHPDDRGQLFVLAAQRLIQDEAANTARNKEKSLNRPLGGKRNFEVIRDEKDPGLAVDNSPLNRPLGGLIAPPVGRSRSYYDRSNVDVTNVRVTSRNESESNRTRSAFAQDPRVSNLTSKEREDREALVLELGDWLRRKHGYRETDAHKSAGAHRRAVYFGGPNLVREAMRILDDRIEAGTAGRKDWIRDPSAAFWGVVRNLATDKGVSLDPGGEVPAERKIEPSARSVETTAAVLEPSRRSVGGVVTQHEPTEDKTPEARARVYADHLFPFQFRIEHDRDPSADEIEAEYEKRLTLYRGQASTERAPSRRF